MTSKAAPALCIVAKGSGMPKMHHAHSDADLQQHANTTSRPANRSKVRLGSGAGCRTQARSSDEPGHHRPNPMRHMNGDARRDSRARRLV
jgi:hypothetical protein